MAKITVYMHIKRRWQRLRTEGEGSLTCNAFKKSFPDVQMGVCTCWYVKWGMQQFWGLRGVQWKLKVNEQLCSSGCRPKWELELCPVGTPKNCSLTNRGWWMDVPKSSSAKHQENTKQPRQSCLVSGAKLAVLELNFTLGNSSMYHLHNCLTYVLQQFSSDDRCASISRSTAIPANETTHSKVDGRTPKHRWEKEGTIATW